MATVDVYGLAITTIRDYPAVAALVGEKVYPQFPPNTAPPAIITVKLGTDLSPFGQRRAGLQSQLVAARCYGTSNVQASAIARAVIDAVNLRGPIQSGGKFWFLSLVESGGNADYDPVTKWPYETVTFSVVAAAQAVA